MHLLQLLGSVSPHKQPISAAEHVVLCKHLARVAAEGNAVNAYKKISGCFEP